MTGRQRPTRAQNPAARAEFVDPLTGQRVPSSTPAAVPTGRKIVRIRPRVDEPFEAVVVDDDDLDPRRDTFGVDPSSTRRYRQIAGAEAAERARVKPLERDADLNLGRIGSNTTFPSPVKAAKIFIENNAHLFDDPSFEDLDAYDATLAYMDGIEVRSGNRRIRLSKTPRGQQILRGGGRASGAAIAESMLAYLFGQAGKGRRWRDVSWPAVDGYVAVIRGAMAADAQRRGAPAPSSAELWYPLASGVYDANTMLALAVEEIGETKAEQLADWLNSQYLYDLAERLEHVLHPRKGVPGRGGRRARKCLSKDDRKTIAARRRQILEWAAYPQEIPQWACVATQATEISRAGICLFPGLDEEVRRVEDACGMPYDPAWPAAERARLCAAGQVEEIDQFGSGVAPLGCEGVGANEIEPLPWESNPVGDDYDQIGGWLIKPSGEIPQIGPETGRKKINGIARYDSPHGSVRYVLYEKARPLSALQLVRLEPDRAVIANVYTKRDLQRRGYATQLLEHARRDFATIEHSEHLTEHGRAWKEKVGNPSARARRLGARIANP